MIYGNNLTIMAKLLLNCVFNSAAWLSVFPVIGGQTQNLYIKWSTDPPRLLNIMHRALGPKAPIKNHNWHFIGISTQTIAITMDLPILLNMMHRISGLKPIANWNQWSQGGNPYECSHCNFRWWFDRITTLDPLGVDY